MQESKGVGEAAIARGGHDVAVFLDVRACGVEEIVSCWGERGRLTGRGREFKLTALSLMSEVHRAGLGHGGCARDTAGKRG